MSENNFPKLHNAAWPGVVGKGPDSEPPIDLDTMLDLTANAEVDGQKFDGALLHDSTAARVGALFQLLVQDTTAQDFGLPSSAIRLRM